MLAQRLPNIIKYPINETNLSLINPNNRNNAKKSNP
jgi:hypothetical protein